MKETLPISELMKPEHQRILDNETKFSLQDVYDARKKLNLEQEDAQRQGITVEELRLKKHTARVGISKQIQEREQQVEKLQSADVKQFGDTCFYFLKESCKKSGSEFKTDDQKTMDLYREIIRYFHWNTECEKLDKNRFMYLFGVYGCGKSMLVKSIYKALQYYRMDNWSYFHLPTLTKNFMAEKNDHAFELLFNCQKNMIIDEIGDKSEKQKYYGNEIESVRSLILEKYDKWIGSNDYAKYQKLVFTSNLFPDKEYFFTQSDHDRPTLRNFYDDKIYNKMGEMCNLVRFPNISYRSTNKVELL